MYGTTAFAPGASGSRPATSCSATVLRSVPPEVQAANPKPMIFVWSVGVMKIVDGEMSP